MTAGRDPLDDFELGAYRGAGFTRAVYRSGDGPNCIVMAEIPGITPAVADFARRVRDRGMSVTLPVLFGDPGAAPTPSRLARSLAQACVGREFAAFATNTTAPIASWLRSLAAAEHDRCGGPGVGAVGMCFTGGFALGMLTEPATIAPVMSQPSLPIGPGGRAADVHLSPADRDAVVARVAADDLRVVGLRFTCDFMSRSARFRTLESLLGDRFIGVELDSSPGNAEGHRIIAHSVLTEDLDDTPGTATHAALEQVLHFLESRLVIA